MLPAAPACATEAPAAFQTPSKRGGTVLWCIWTRGECQFHVSNPFKTGRYCAVRIPRGTKLVIDGVSNPFKTGRYCAEAPDTDDKSVSVEVSNPFKTGRYCAVFYLNESGPSGTFQTPSKRGGTVLRVASGAIWVWRIGEQNHAHHRCPPSLMRSCALVDLQV